MSVLITPRLIDPPVTCRVGGSGGSGQPDDLGPLLACILIQPALNHPADGARTPTDGQVFATGADLLA